MLSLDQRSDELMTDRLENLAYRVRRLAPSHRDPERYHVEKSEIERELRKLAKEVRA